MRVGLATIDFRLEKEEMMVIYAMIQKLNLWSDPGKSSPMTTSEGELKKRRKFHTFLNNNNRGR